MSVWIYVKDKGLDEAIEMAINTWAEMFPHEVTQWLARVEHLNACAALSTRDRDLWLKASLPPRVDGLLHNLWSGFLHEEENYAKVVRVLKKAIIDSPPARTFQPPENRPQCDPPGLSGGGKADADLGGAVGG